MDEFTHYGGQSTKKLDRDALDNLYWQSFLYFYKKHYGHSIYAALRTLLQVRIMLSRWVHGVKMSFRLVRRY